MTMIFMPSLGYQSLAFEALLSHKKVSPTKTNHPSLGALLRLMPCT
jgi:hypothetical protein